MVFGNTRDFRSNQSKYLRMASGGESVILQSRMGNYQLKPLSSTDMVEDKKLLAELRAALQEVKDALDGKRTLQSLDSLLNEL